MRESGIEVAPFLPVRFPSFTSKVNYRNHRKERIISQSQMDELTKRSMLSFVEQHDFHVPERHKPLVDLFVNQNFSLPFKDNQIDIMTDGYAFFPELLKDIAEATHHIHINMYIFENDAVGRLVADALMDKARQGIKVRLIYDDVGCWRVGNRFFEQMRESGIEVAPFLPVRFPSFTSKVNYRTQPPQNHHYRRSCGLYRRHECCPTLRVRQVA